MSTTVVESPVLAPEPTGARIEIAKERTISLLPEFRCTKPTRVSPGVEKSVTPCGAEAFVHVIFSVADDLERFLCKHHADEDWTSLVKVAELIRDERSFINKTASPSANAV